MALKRGLRATHTMLLRLFAILLLILMYGLVFFVQLYPLATRAATNRTQRAP